jgi:hypothetical protein
LPVRRTERNQRSAIFQTFVEQSLPFGTRPDAGFRVAVEEYLPRIESALQQLLLEFQCRAVVLRAMADEEHDFLDVGAPGGQLGQRYERPLLP